MLWQKKYRCKECRKEYTGTQYTTKDEKGKDIILCEDCCNKIINTDLKEYKKKEVEFENKKKSKKYLYKQLFIGELNKKKIKFETDIYSDKKLTKAETKQIAYSNNGKLLILKKHVLSAKKGDIVLKGETFILPTINLDKKEKDYSKYSDEELKKIKLKKRIIIVITKR